MFRHKMPQFYFITTLVFVVLSGCAKDRPHNDGHMKDKLDMPFYAPVSVPEQQLVRTLLNSFSDKGAAGVDVTVVLGLIEQEGLRNYPDSAWIDDFFLSNVTLDMTKALPTEDLWGDYNPQGGALRFQEIVHDESGEVTSDEWVTKPAQSFTEGVVEGFNYRSILQDTSKLTTSGDHLLSFSVATDTTYQTDTWHSQQGYSSASNGEASFNEQYAYQSAPSMTLTLNAGSEHETTHKSADTIHSGTGWTLEQESTQKSTLTGTLTLYQPSAENAEANIREAKPASTTSTVVKNAKSSNQDWTTVTTTETYANPEETIIRREEVTHTYEEQVERDASSGALFSDNSYEHITKRVSYHPVEGASEQLLQNRSLEDFSDYEETTKTLRQSTTNYRSFPEEQVSCAIGGSGTCPSGTVCTEGPNGEGRCMGMGCPNDEKMWGTTGTGAAVCSLPLSHDETITVYRYTSNPATRHDIAAWKSTEASWTRNWNEDKEYVDIYLGEKWLIEQIVVDPDFDSVSFVWDGTKSNKSTDSTKIIFSGASQSQSLSSAKMDVEVGWGGNAISVDGSYDHAQTSISDEVGALEHSNGGNAQGTFEIKINDATYSISAEQWLDQIAP